MPKHIEDRPTPETDKLSAKLYNESPRGSLTDRGFKVAGELADHARRLERQRDAALERVEAGKKLYELTLANQMRWMKEHGEMQRQRDAAVEALESVMKYAESGRVFHGLFSETEPTMENARATLAAIKGGK